MQSDAKMPISTQHNEAAHLARRQATKRRRNSSLPSRTGLPACLPIHTAPPPPAEEEAALLCFALLRCAAPLSAWQALQARTGERGEGRQRGRGRGRRGISWRGSSRPRCRRGRRCMREDAKRGRQRNEATAPPAPQDTYTHTHTHTHTRTPPSHRKRE